MKVLYDHQIFERQRFGGISRYFVELIRGLHGTAAVDVALALARSMHEDVPDLNRRLGLSVTDRGFPETFLGGARVPLRKHVRAVAKWLDRSLDARVANRKLALERLREGGFDLFHPTYYDPYFVKALRGRPYVLTVYDMTHEVWPEYFAHHDPTTRWKLDLVRGARRIIAISERTKRDVVALAGVDPAKVDVIHLAFSRPNGVPAALPGDVPARFLLFTGTRGQYKNWAFLVRALAPLLERDRELHLICSGPPFRREERAFLDELGLAGKVVHVRADERVLVALYGRAAAFVFPSLSEGFGIPVLEALATGCPAALANASCLPEVGGDAALYFDPKDARSVRETVERLLTDDALRDDLVRRGKERAAAFSWQQTCAATTETYRRALAG